MTRPLIGITTYWVRAWELGPNRVRGLPEQDMVMSTADYARCLEGAGGAPVLLPLQGPEAAEALLGRLDGLVLAGGSDLNPMTYGRTVNRHVGRVVPERDAFELALVARALDRGLPVLGICRGFQVLNVHFGGTLHRDLDADRPGPLHHAALMLPKAEVAHRVDLAEGSALARAFGAVAVPVNSLHHQGVDALGEGLLATGWAEDGLVEAFEHPGFPFVLGVQWHPEMMGKACPEQLAPFRLLVEAAR